MQGKLLFNIKKDRPCSRQAIEGEVPPKCSQNEVSKIGMKTGFPRGGGLEQCSETMLLEAAYN